MESDRQLASEGKIICMAFLDHTNALGLYTHWHDIVLYTAQVGMTNQQRRVASLTPYYTDLYSLRRHMVHILSLQTHFLK